MTPDTFIDVAQLVLGFALAGASLCRLNLLGREHRIRYRVTYCLLLTSSIAVALSPWMFHQANAGTPFIMLAIILYLKLPGNEWKNEPPDAACSRPGDLW